MRLFSAMGAGTICLAIALLANPGGAATPANDDLAITQGLAQMLRAARTVVSVNQPLINNPDIGDKGLSGSVVLARTLAGYKAATGTDATAIDAASREGRLLHAEMDSIVEVTDDNQDNINARGVGFKGFIPAVFARLVSEEFARRANGEGSIKVTAPVDLVRNRKALPDAWEDQVIRTKFLSPSWPSGQPYGAEVTAGEHQSYRMMFPEYYAASCLSCHGDPKGSLDITGYPREGAKEHDLGGVISITLTH
jgi:hypothetical protein